MEMILIWHVLMKGQLRNKHSKLTRLSQLNVGQSACIARIEGGRQLVRRLLSLGLREGSEVNVLQRRGHSVVVSSAGTRVAIGATIADKLLMKSVPRSFDR